MDKAGKFRYRVSSFVDLYIEQKMTPQMKKNYLDMVCTYLNMKLI